MIDQSDLEERVQFLSEEFERLKKRLPAQSVFRPGNPFVWENPLRTPGRIIDSRHLKLGSITADMITAGSIDTSLLNVWTVLVADAVWTDSSPVAGSVAWSGATVYYRGTGYPITNGNTANKYIWWSSTTTPTVFQSSNTRPTLTDVEFMIATNTAGAHDLVWNALGTTGVFPGHLSFEAMASLFIYGDGVDGDVTISGNTTLTRDVSYNNLTINNGVVLTPAGYRIYVKNTLTNNGTIRANGSNGTIGDSGGGGGAFGPGAVGNYFGAGSDGGQGGGLDAAGSNGAALTNGLGGVGGTGGTGDGGTAQWSGGAGGAITTTRANRHGLMLLGDTTEIRGGTGGGGGGGGNVNVSPAENAWNGGGGGGGGGVIIIAARTITNNGTIEAKGGNGGDGGDHPISSENDGGGGGGGGGGALVLVYRTITQGTLSVAGGAGGVNPASAGHGQGTDGASGSTGLTLLIQQES